MKNIHHLLRRAVLPATLILIIGCTPSPSDTVIPKRKFSNADIEHKVDSLLGLMTLEEKVGQMNLRGTSSRSDAELSDSLKDDVRAGRVGSFLNIMNKDHREELQRIAVEESKHGIPLLFGRDVIHGFKTIFPIPLGQAASWNPTLAEEGARISAREASTYGINWTFAPMMDVTRDPRWGRIAESLGEDPYLTSQLAVAMIEGFQGDFDQYSLAACAKHFAAYGAAEAGRDYNTAQVPEYLLRDIYLPPFRAASDAGVASMMAAFNDISGIPATGNKMTLEKILRQEWGYDGFVVSDWHSVIEMIPHGYAVDEKDAAAKAILAGTDMEMMSTAYEENLIQLVEEGKVPVEVLDERVAAILRVKYRIGLFDDPGFNRNEEGVILSEEHKAAARDAAVESMVLLRNEKNLLPLKSGTKVALIGPLADAPHEQLGTWTFDGEASTSVTPLQTFREELGADLHFVPALTHSRDKNTSQFNEALAAAARTDVILFVGGEEAILSGEAHSRGDITLPGRQEDLIRELSATGKPVILVVMAGRPITFENILQYTDAILMAWHPGTMAGPALYDLIFGLESPSGRLPVTWPKAVGQIPIYYNHYNTGRPATPDEYTPIDSIPVGAWQSSIGNTSHHLDYGYTPQWPFGFGLTYSTVEYSDLKLSQAQMTTDGSITVTALITNSGNRVAKEVVQLYVRDITGSRVRPVRELKGFQKITLDPGESREVSFTLDAGQLAFTTATMERRTEPGEFLLWVAPNAEAGLEAAFRVTE